jgi:DNA-binding transcriptional ArsR family regulator
MSYRSASSDSVFAAIADETRRAIVQRVARGALTAGELARGFRISRPAVSKHVRVLVRAGLLREQRQGRNRVYELDAAPLRAVDAWLAQYRDFWRGNLRNLKSYVECSEVGTTTTNSGLTSEQV